MSSTNTPESSESEPIVWKIAFVGLIGVFGFLVVMLVGLISGTSPLLMIDHTIDAVFAVHSVQAMWYITRAAGLTAYLLLWLSTVWGVAVSSKILDPVLHRGVTYDFHQFLSLLALGFVAVHVVVLLADRYLPYTLAQVLVPFTGTYRPAWVGVGIIGMYLSVLVSITFYIRRWIGQRTFRVIHYLSFIAFLFAALHGLFAGTDSPLWTVQGMYAVTILVVVFLTAYRILVALPRREQNLAH